MPANEVSLRIPSAALALSLGAFVTTRLRDGDLLLRVHERLIAADQQRRRGRVYAMSDEHTRVEDLSHDDYVVINNALASLKTLGIYYRRRYIRRKDVLELWAASARLIRAAQPFLAHRDELVGTHTWPELRAFALAAERHLKRNGVEVMAVESPNPGV